MGCKRLGTPIRSRRKRSKGFSLVYTVNLMSQEASWFSYGLNQLAKHIGAGVTNMGVNKRGQYAYVPSSQPHENLEQSQLIREAQILTITLF